MKKLLLLTSLALMGAGANAAELVDGLYYELSGSNATLVKTQSPDVTYTGDVVVPSTITVGGTTYNVNAIGNGAFEFSTVTSVKLPDTSITVNAYAFDTSTIKRIWLGKLTDLKGNAISAFCDGLTDLYSPNDWGIPMLLSAAVNSKIRKQTILHIPNGTLSSYTSQGWSNFVLYLYNGQEKIGDVCYQLNDDNTAKILSPYYLWRNQQPNRYDNDGFDFVNITGNAVIPEFVEYDGNKYRVTEMDNECFYQSTFTSMVLPAGLKEVSWESFYETKITSIVIPDEVTKIGEGAFSNCWDLSDITLGASLQELESGDYGMFAQCPLTKIICKAKTPPTVGDGVFYATTSAGVNQYDATLYVPAGSVEAYKAAPEWKKFTNIQPILVPAESITLSDSEITLSEEGQTFTLTYEVTPADATDEAIWTSSDETVATVADGVVTAVANGTAVITLTVGEATASCNVTVAINSGVAQIAIIDGIPARYYNLQGIEIANPEKGQMVIVRQGNRSFKAVM